MKLKRVRGGAWYIIDSGFRRCAWRDWGDSGNRLDLNGFRIVFPPFFVKDKRKVRK